MNNSEYWAKRFTQLEDSMNEVGRGTYYSIEPTFINAQKEIQAQIDTWITRVAKNNQVTMAEARKLLNSKELAEFKWDVYEYIKYGKQNALDGKWVKQLENASARYHISRLEALKISTQQSLEKAFGNELDAIDDMAKRAFTEGYYHSCFEIQKGFNIGWNIGQVNDTKLSKLISKPWTADRRTFSDRIWQSKGQMISDLHTELTRTCLLGKAPDQAIKNMTKYVDGKFKNAKAQAGRLVMTEQAFFASSAQKEAFNDLDVEEFEIVATLDSKTSPICREMDGRHFPMSAFQSGSTAPPFHPWCRSCTCPYFDDEFSADDMRAARGADGKTYYVPATMKYPEWKEKFVDGGLTGKGGSDIIEEKLKRRELKLEINSGNQNKHIVGSHSYNESLRKSVLYGDLETAQKLVNDSYGTGVLKFSNKGDWVNKEIITLDRVIGEVFDNELNGYSQTNKIAIHYGKNGTHVVPMKKEN